MSIATLIRNMAAAGATPEAIAIAVEAIEAAQAVQPKRPRTGSAERMARKRARDAEASQVTQDVTQCDAESDASDASGDALPLALPPSPQTPQPPTHTRRDSSRARKADQFEVFWTAYPLKKAKLAARKRYDAALAEIGGDDPHGVIMAGLAKALSGWTDPKFIPHPTTWLNQGRWADEPAPAAIKSLPLLASSSAPVAAAYDGPAALRNSVARVAGEPFAVKYIDQCRWDAETRTLIAKTGFAADEIRNELRRWLVEHDVRVAVAARAQPEGAAA